MDSQATFVGASMATRLVMDKISRPKNALLEFMDLSGTNYKFMDPKMHFQSLWTYISKFMDLSDTNYKLMDLKMHF
jgi:hypothetical protein